jgi:hypothetical protein
MSVLTTMSRVPLFNTKEQAIAWANDNGLSGYHTHRWKTQIGYMGGINHHSARIALGNGEVSYMKPKENNIQISTTVLNRIQPTPATPTAPTQSRNVTRDRINRGRSATGGGGGGGGY